METNKELYTKQTTEKMMGIIRRMLQSAFNEAFCRAYGESWFDGFKAASREHATNTDGEYNRAFDIAGDKNSVSGLDFSACVKTIIYLDEYRKTLLLHFHAQMSENAICDVCHKLIAYRNYGSFAHDNDEDKPDFVISSELCMENMKFLAGFFSSVMDSATGTSYKDELEQLYVDYKNETNKKFYAFDEVFDTSKYSLDKYIKAANHCGIAVYLSDSVLKQGFDSFDLEKDKQRILRAVALINDSTPAPAKNKPKQIIDSVIKPAADKAIVAVKENKPEKQKVQKVIVVALALLILFLVTVLASMGISRAVSNKAEDDTAVSTMAITTTSATTEPTTTTTTEPTTTTTTKKQKVTYVEGEATFRGELEFKVEKQDFSSGYITLVIYNHSDENTYSFTQAKSWGSSEYKLSKVFINDIDTHKKISNSYGKDYWTMELMPDQTSNPIIIPVDGIKDIKSITITNVSYDSGTNHIFNDVTIKIKTTKE